MLLFRYGHAELLCSIWELLDVAPEQRPASGALKLGDRQKPSLLGHAGISIILEAKITLKVSSYRKSIATGAQRFTQPIFLNCIRVFKFLTTYFVKHRRSLEQKDGNYGW
jgi:hypothetical protein